MFLICLNTHINKIGNKCKKGLSTKLFEGNLGKLGSATKEGISAETGGDLV